MLGKRKKETESSEKALDFAYEARADQRDQDRKHMERRRTNRIKKK